MKKSLFLLMSLFLWVSCDPVNNNQKFVQIDPGEIAPDLDYVFDLTVVPKITISLSVDEWNTLLTNYDTKPANEENVHADFTFDKNGQIETFQNVSLRLRGNTSRRRPEGDHADYVANSTPGVLHGEAGNFYHSAHFRIGFNQFVPGVRFHGLRNLNLKWFKDDPNYAREIYCYDLFKEFGVDIAPRASYSRVYIHIKETDETIYFGVYSMVESLDQSYLNGHFSGNNTGYLWKCLGGDMSSTSGMGIENITLTSSYRPLYDLKTQKQDFSRGESMFIEFIDQLNAHSDGSASLKAWLESSMDVDGFLKALAVTVTVGGWDTLWLFGSNYYFYFDNSGKGHYIPYDFDNTLGTSSVVNSGTFDVTQIEAYGNPLVEKVLSVTEFRNSYESYLGLLINQSESYFDITYSTNRIKQWQDMIQPYMTGQDVVGDAENYSNMIADFPARAWGGTGWGNQDYYRFFSGDDSGLGNTLPGANFFKTRSQFAASQLGLPALTW